VSYDPALGPSNKAGALNRQKEVLQAMITQKMVLDGKPITQTMATEAETMTSNMTFGLSPSIKRAPSFVDYVINQVETALGNGDPNAGVEAFVTGGYNIRTTIDVNLDEYAQTAIQRHLYQPELQKGPTANCEQPVTLANPTNGTYCNGTAMPSNVQNAAVVVQDVRNGEILAMVGSANYNSSTPEVTGNYNDAVSVRSPGSTFKLFDYATAFEMGWNPGITLADTMTDFPNGAQAGASVPATEADAVNDPAAYPGVYLPSDYGATWWNFLESITWATANSMNVPAIRAMQFASPQAVKDTAERLGLTFPSDESFGYAAAIGADGATPLQMVNAYAAFGNGGVRVPPQTILDISNNAGVDLYHYNENAPAGIQVVSPQVAYEMTGVLSNEPARDFEFSGDHDLSFADIDPTCATNAVCNVQLAAKTGTTDNFTDNWTIGYTPEVAVAVWVGNNNNSPLVNSIGITGAAPIFHSVIERTLGWCNDSTSTFANQSDPYAIADQVPCGPGGDYNFPFSGHPQLTFTEPSGLTQGISAGLPTSSAPTTSYSPLPASGAATSDWMLSGD
jgi:membrane peptidoglycan carboxypeptidase